MTKQELIDAIVERADLDRQQATAALDAALDVIAQTLAGGGEVTLTGFGKFHVAVRGARAGVNPRTGETIQIGAATVPRFTAGSNLKKAVRS